MNNLVIVNQGRSSCGKSNSIRRVWELLLEKYPKTSNLIMDDGDVKATVKIGDVLVGIESQGDPKSRMFESLEEFMKMGCNIIVIPCRTSGRTYQVVADLNEEYGWDFMYCQNERYWGENEDEVRDMLNQQYAEQVVRLIEDRIAGRI